MQDMRHGVPETLAVEYYRLSAESGAITFTPKDLDILASYGICQEDAQLAEDYINHLPN